MSVLAAVFNLNHPAHTVDWHFIHLSVANVVVIGLMLVVFVARDPAAVPRRRERREAARRERRLHHERRPEPTPSKSWTVKVRETAVEALPPEKLLPDGQPTYVASWIYVFGVASIASLIVIIGSGSILALKGPAWWHDTGVGHFFNSIHLWAVELFFFVMVVHLWGKYWMAAWRGGRARVWVTGAITFLVAVPAALTGYVSQQNFDAQWISTQAKDAMNSVGVGAFFNLTNFGQMYSYHVLLLPLAVVAAGEPRTCCSCAATASCRRSSSTRSCRRRPAPQPPEPDGLAAGLTSSPGAAA